LAPKSSVKPKSSAINRTCELDDAEGVGGAIAGRECDAGHRGGAGHWQRNRAGAVPIRARVECNDPDFEAAKATMLAAAYATRSEPDLRH